MKAYHISPVQPWPRGLLWQVRNLSRRVTQ